MYLLPLIVTRGRFSIFFTVDVFEIWSEEVSSSYSATDCARSRARNRAVEEINGSLEARELDISIKSDEMRSWLRIKLIIDVDDQPVLGATCLHCLHSAMQKSCEFLALEIFYTPPRRHFSTVTLLLLKP